MFRWKVILPDQSIEWIEGKSAFDVSAYTHFGSVIRKRKPQDGLFQIFEESGRLIDQQLVVNGAIFAYTPGSGSKFVLWDDPDNKRPHLYSKEEVERLAKLVSFQ
jgi:hypothetical protein